MSNLIAFIDGIIQKQESTLKPNEDGDKNLDLLNRFYGKQLPKEIQNLFKTYSDGFLKLDDYNDWRLLSVEEIVCAANELNVPSFSNVRMPIWDTGNNNFICFNFEKKKYELFNIVDELPFRKVNQLIEFLNNPNS